MNTGTSRRICQVLNIVFSLYLVVQYSSCVADGGGTIGPCVHTYKEPILHIERARNARTGAPVQTVILRLIAIDSISQNPYRFMPGSHGVAVLDSSLVCNPPCAFGTEQGRYTFTVSAKGCRDTVVTCYPSYAINIGGCPSSSDGGLRITLVLPGE